MREGERGTLPAEDEGKSHEISDSCERTRFSRILKGKREAWSKISFFAGLAIAFGIALFLRLPELDLRPLHHDEGFLGWLSLRLYWWGVHQYGHYHGPVIHFLNLPFLLFFGPNETSLRLASALAGSFSIPLLLLFRPLLGSLGVLVSAWLLATSPAAVYYSRTAIPESILIALTAIIAACVLRFFRLPSTRWILLGSAAFMIALATKETIVLAAASLAGASVVWIRRTPEPNTPSVRRVLRKSFLPSFLLSALLFVVLFSSFFVDLEGPVAFFGVFTSWFDIGAGGLNQGRPVNYFVTLLIETELLPSALAIGCGLLAAGLRSRVGLYFFGWALLILVAYSIPSYKTPWCVLNLILPLYLLCGWGAHRLVQLRSNPRPYVRAISMLLPILLIPYGCLAARESHRITRHRFDDPLVHYAFAQTSRPFYRTVSDLIECAAETVPDGAGLRVVSVVEIDPLRWYLLTRGWEPRRIHRVQKLTPEDIRWAQAIVVPSHIRHVSPLTMLEGERHSWHLETCLLRPNIYCQLWIRRPLWNAYRPLRVSSAPRKPPQAIRPLSTPRTPKRLDLRETTRNALSQWMSPSEN